MQLSIQSPKLLRGIILTTISVFIYHLLVTGEINFLVSPIISIILEIILIPLCLISLTTLFLSVFKMKRQASAHLAGPHSHAGDDGHHHLNSTTFWYRTTIGLLLLFIVLAFTWHPVSLGTNMISGSDSGLNSSSSGLSQSSSANSLINTGGNGIATSSSGISQAYIAFKYNKNPAHFIGKPVQLIGFVYHPKGLPQNQIILTRFFVFCCIADAVPIGIAVESPQASQFKSNTWVQVSGTMQTKNIPALEKLEPTNSWVPKKNNQPFIMAQSIKSIPVPSKPYMVPNF